MIGLLKWLKKYTTQTKFFSRNEIRFQNIKYDFE